MTKAEIKHEILETYPLWKGTDDSVHGDNYAESHKNLEHSTMSGFSITSKEAFPGASWLTVDMNGELDLGDVNWEIS